MDDGRTTKHAAQWPAFWRWLDRMDSHLIWRGVIAAMVLFWIMVFTVL